MSTARHSTNAQRSLVEAEDDGAELVLRHCLLEGVNLVLGAAPEHGPELVTKVISAVRLVNAPIVEPRVSQSARPNPLEREVDTHPTTCSVLNAFKEARSLPSPQALQILEPFWPNLPLPAAPEPWVLAGAEGVDVFVGALVVAGAAWVEEDSRRALAVVCACAVEEWASLLRVLERTLQRLLVSRLLFAMGAWSM